jgi:hypothetical protein
MEVLRPVLCLCFLVIAGCEQTPTVCEGEHVRAGIVQGFVPETSPSFALFKNLQLKEIKVLKEDESTGVTECTARIVIPTEQGPIDSPVTYRVGPAASDGRSVFMTFVLDKAIEKLYDTVERVTERTVGKAS